MGVTVDNMGIVALQVVAEYHSQKEIAELNSYLAYETGWAIAFEEICGVFGINPVNTTPRDFGNAVARWQEANGLLPADGVFDNISWEKFRIQYMNRFITNYKYKPDMPKTPQWLKSKKPLRKKYDVPVMLQHNDPTCWAVSANMVEKYYTGKYTNFIVNVSARMKELSDNYSMDENDALYEAFKERREVLDVLQHIRDENTKHILDDEIKRYKKELSIIEIGQQEMKWVQAGFRRVYNEIDSHFSRYDLMFHLVTKGPLMAVHDPKFLFYSEYSDGVQDDSNHVSVITGMDLEKDLVYINDPNLKKKDNEVKRQLVIAAIAILRRDSRQNSLWFYENQKSH